MFGCPYQLVDCEGTIRLPELVAELPNVERQIVVPAKQSETEQSRVCGFILTGPTCCAERGGSHGALKRQSGGFRLAGLETDEELLNLLVQPNHGIQRERNSGGSGSLKVLWQPFVSLHTLHDRIEAGGL